jgi:Putative Ig domain
MSRNHIVLGIGCTAKSAGTCFLSFAAVSCVLLLMLGCGGSKTSTMPSIQTTPPTNLAYSQPTMTAIVGVAISVDAPTVTGTVSSYAVSPALPAGLSLSASSGAISGTATAASAKASYTITASNSGGSTTATVQITVNQAVTPPSNLIYPQTSLSLEAGQPFPSDIPTVSGTVASYNVSPALPTGLNLDANTGTIYGAPSAPSTSNTYTVTASNAGGNTTAAVTLAVNPALVTLLNLGSAKPVTKIFTVGSNVVEQDLSGHWVLIDYSSGSELATGEQGINWQGNPWPIYMAGSTLAVGVANGVEVRSAATGSLQAIISSPMIDQDAAIWWRLGSDGSYICAGSSTGLTAWSNSGTVLFALSGNYSTANVFAAPGQIQIALGPSGAAVIQTVLTTSGSSSVGPAFSGNFNTWSQDGTFFLTSLSNNIWTYTAASSQTGFLTTSSAFNALGGEGGWIWTVSNGTTPAVTIYAVGSTTVAAAYPIGVDDMVVPYGDTLGLLACGAPTVTVVDLSGTNPVARSPYTVPTAYNVAYAAFSPSQWVTGNVHGTIFDGASLASTPRFLTQGAAFDIAGSNSIVAVAGADGTIYIFDPANTTPQQTIAFSSSEVQLSTDGTVLAAAANSKDTQYEPVETLNIYALPAGTVSHSWPYQAAGTNLFSFSLATSGSTIGQATGTYNGSNWQYARQVTAITGGPVIWSDTPSSAIEPLQVPPPLLSPDGTLIAAANDTRTPSAVTNINRNGTAVTVVPGFAVGWIDDGDLLVDTYTILGLGDVITYNGCSIYSSTGTLIASPPLPEIMNFQTVSSGLIYTPDSNTIYSTSTGSATWTSIYPYGGVGATAAGDVVFLSGARVVVQSQ